MLLQGCQCLALVAAKHRRVCKRAGTPADTLERFAKTLMGSALSEPPQWWPRHGVLYAWPSWHTMCPSTHTNPMVDPAQLQLKWYTMPLGGKAIVPTTSALSGAPASATVGSVSGAAANGTPGVGARVHTTPGSGSF